MKLQATKTMARELTSLLPERTTIEHFIQSTRPATMLDDWNDIDYDNNGYPIVKTIKVIYKPECYAMNNEITTNDLIKIVKRNGIRTTAELITEILNEYEI